MKLSAEEQARYDELKVQITHAWNKAAIAFIRSERANDIAERADYLRELGKYDAEYRRLHDQFEPLSLKAWADDEAELATFRHRVIPDNYWHEAMKAILWGEGDKL